MADNNKLVRKNIRMSQDVASWYEKRAKELGVSQSNLMVMALSEYMKQDKAISSIKEVLDKLEKIKKEWFKC